MNPFRFLTGTVPALALALCAQAHPGHGLGEQGALHAVTSPYHLAVLALCGAGLWGGARWVQRRAPRRLLQSAGAAALVVATLLLGVRA